MTSAVLQLMKKHSQLKVALITGAGTGIGLALAKRLREREDVHVVLTARAGSMDRFAAEGIQEGERLWLRALDVTDADQRREVIGEIERELGGVDWLVNNAGITFRSVVEHVTEEERLLQMGVNFRGPMELARLVLPGMRARRSGRILNVSSVGGMMAMPTMAVYSASKFALEGASEALYYEVKPWNIRVTLLQLGFINSDAFEKVPYTGLSRRAAADPADPYHAHYQHMSGFIAKFMRLSVTTPEGVARRMERILRSRRPPLRVRGTPDAVLFDCLRAMLPHRLYHWILYRSLPGIRKWGD